MECLNLLKCCLFLTVCGSLSAFIVSFYEKFADVSRVTTRFLYLTFNIVRSLALMTVNVVICV